MTLANTIKKAEKLSGQKINTSGNFYWVDYKGFRISFREDRDHNTADCFYTLRDGMKDDHEGGYYEGTSWETLTRAFRSVDRRAN